MLHLIRAGNIFTQALNRVYVFEYKDHHVLGVVFCKFSSRLRKESVRQLLPGRTMRK